MRNTRKNLTHRFDMVIAERDVYISNIYSPGTRTLYQVTYWGNTTLHMTPAEFSAWMDGWINRKRVEDIIDLKLLEKYGS